MSKLGSAIVFDNGSGCSKSGFAGDHEPKLVFPTKVGRPRAQFVANYHHLELKDAYVGQEAQANRQVLHMKHPVERGIVKSWDDMEKLWEYTYKELDLESEEHPLLLTDVPNNPEKNREKMAEILFETFNTPAMYIAVQGILALYAYGLVTGVAIDCGEDVSQIVPAIEGFMIPESTTRLDFGGSDLNNYLMNTLSESGIDFSTEYTTDDVCKIKERHCFVTRDYNKEVNTDKASLKKQYELPDQQIITLGEEQFKCPELYFQPDLINRDHKGLHTLCYNNIQNCEDSDDLLQEELYANIVLSGGSTMFYGFSERMEAEIVKLAPAKTKVSVMAVPRREYNVWLGGSIIASQSAFKDMWLTKEKYEESGPSIIHKKCV